MDSFATHSQIQPEHLQAILLELSEPIVAVDENDKVVFANAGAAELFGFDLATAADRELRSFVGCDEVLDLVRTVREANARRRSRDIAVKDQAGVFHWYRAAARSLRPVHVSSSSSATPSGVIIVMQDINAQKTMEQRSACFVAAISHEMKTPLAGIKAFVELLQDGEADDEQTKNEFLEVISAQANRLQRLVDNMVRLAQIEAGVTRVNKQNCSLNELLCEALRTVEATAQGENITLHSDLSPDDLQVLVDRDMTLQAVIHLLATAIKSAPRGGLVTLRTRPAGHEAQFEVEDNGARLSNEECRRVFEKFYTLRPTRGPAVGTGLGMPLVKHVVEHVHGGSVELCSTSERGNVFCVFLPSAEAADEHFREFANEMAASNEETS